jgi:hypothetical protein
VGAGFLMEWTAAASAPGTVLDVALAPPVLNADNSVSLAVSDIGQESTAYYRDGVLIGTAAGAGGFVDFAPEP